MVRDKRNGSDELQSGAVTGARAVSRLAKAAAKLASGNAAAAAAEAGRDGKAVLAAVIAGAVIIVSVFFTAPLTLYEGIWGAESGFRSRWEELREQWQTGFYEGTEGPLPRFFNAVLGLGDQEGGQRESNAGTEDTPTADDLRLLGDEAALKAVYKRKLDAVRSKLKARADELKAAVPADAISAVMAGRFEKEWAHKYDGDDTTEVVFDSTNVMVSTQGIGPSQCLQLLCLYSAQIHTGLDNVRLSGLLRWLGYKGIPGDTLSYAVGDSGFSASVPAWKGCFMPQYLMDEASARSMTEEYSDTFGCSVCDFLLYISCPDLSSIPAVASEEIRREQRTVYTLKTYVYRDYNDPVKPVLNPDGSVALMQGPYHTEWSSEYRMDIAVRNADAPQGVYYVNRRFDVLIPEVRPVDVTCIHVRYTVPVHILCRNIQEITALTGLWEGWLPSEAPYSLAAEGRE